MTRSKNSRKRKHGRNPNLQKKPKYHRQSHDPILFGPDSDSEEPANIQKLLESCPKDKLINFLCDAALADSSLLAKIQSVADRDISHLKVFVHGLSYDTTQENLLETFKPFGPIKDCHLVIDKATGRSKGYGFVVFKSWDGAAKALKQPQKQIKTRVAFCQLASMGPVPPGLTGPHADTAGRKVYVTRVNAGAAPDKLRALFSQFGEIETGPMGFDKKTGKSRGYALFVYKTQEGAKKALAQPYIMFEGHQLHVQRATETNKGKGVMASAEPVLGSAPQPLLGAATQPSLGAAPQPVLAAVAAAQNLALYSQNPAYATLLGQNPLLAAALNPLAWNPAAMNPTMVNATALNQMAGTGLGSYGGSPSLLGAYGSQGTGAFQAAQYGQYTLGWPGRSFDGMAS